MPLEARDWTWSPRCSSQISVRSHGGLLFSCYKTEGRSLIVPQRFRHLPPFSSVYHQLLHRVSPVLMQFYQKLFELTYVSYAEASSQMV